jgi:hypothetical protein
MHYGVRDISHLLSIMLAKKQLKITYATWVEVGAYSPLCHVDACRRRTSTP